MTRRTRDEIWQWTTPEEAGREQARYWESRTIEERVGAVETLRRASIRLYGEAPARLERTLRIVDLSSRAGLHEADDD